MLKVATPFFGDVVKLLKTAQKVKAAVSNYSWRI